MIIHTLLIFILISFVSFVAIFGYLYLRRLLTVFTIEKVSSYDDYNLYRMNIRYDYSLENVINYGIHDDDSMIMAILKEALPYIPMKMKSPSFACTVFTLKDSDGCVHMGRSYDFIKETSSMLVYCNPRKGYKSVAFSALDNLNANEPQLNFIKRLSTLATPFICLDGVNEKGVSIAILALDSKPVNQNTGKPKITTTLAIRLVLDNAATTEEAVSLLSKYDMIASAGLDYHFYITDATGDGRVVEYDCESGKRELVVTPINVVTNFYAMYADKVLENQDNGIYGAGKSRYRAVVDIINETKTPSNKTVWRALKAISREPNINEVTSNTQWSINYNNTKQIAEIVIRRKWKDVFKYDLSKNKFI